MSSVVVVTFDLHENSVIFAAKVNGEPVDFILDTGDAVGPVFNSADAQRLNLQATAAEGVSGAGGASQVYATTANVALDIIEWRDEPSAIDPSLQGPSLLGLPFFLRNCDQMALDFSVSQLRVVNGDRKGHFLP